MDDLSDLREREEDAKAYWIECLMSVDEMLSMRADDPQRGCLVALRDAQENAMQAGRKVRVLQERIAKLVGPSGPMPSMIGFNWSKTVHA